VKRSCRGLIWGYCLGSLPGETEEIHDRHCPTRYSNRTLPEYKSEALPRSHLALCIEVLYIWSLWIAFVWFIMMWANDGILWIYYWYFGFRKRRRICWLAKAILACKDFWSVESIRFAVAESCLITKGRMNRVQSGVKFTNPCTPYS
jgi:hypothetical protein